MIYVMSRDQRVQDNFALMEAQNLAIENKLPLAVIFVLNAGNKSRATEHYEFMLKGLLEVESDLVKFNIPLIMLIGNPLEKLNIALNEFKPLRVFMDFNPLNAPQKLVKNIATRFNLTVVDNHNIVPVWVTSNKQEYAARTIRPKIHKLVANYLLETPKLQKHPVDWPGKFYKISELSTQISSEISKLSQNYTNIQFLPGEAAAHRQLSDFLHKNFNNYSVARNDPSVNGLSNLSPYLHFGQISSLRVILEAKIAKSDSEESYDALFEELVVRKELSDNYCFYNSKYNSLSGAPQWAQNTLTKHIADNKDYIYTLRQFETAQTYDIAWNSAQKQLLKTGKIHGYMRMYWAKKVLEWSKTPQEAHKILQYLNDFYSIDGGDPNGFVGILWSIGGLHDRPWGERPVFGTVRCMVYSGLQRKFDINKYIQDNS